MTNLDPVFCKMYLSIWIRGMSFFLAPIFPFFGRQNWPFLGVWLLCSNWGATLLKLRCTEEQVNFRQDPRLTLLKIIINNNRGHLVGQLTRFYNKLLIASHYKSEKYQHVEESRMLAICKTLISFTMALNLSSIYSDQRVKRVLLHLVPSPPLPLLPCFTGSTIFTSSHCKQAMLGFVSTSLALSSCYSTRPDAPLFHLSLPEK